MQSPDNTPAAAGRSLMDQLPACARSVCYEKDGVILAVFMTPHCIEKTKAFKTRPDDVFVVTYPKTGTTWAQLIAYLVREDGDEKALEGKNVTNEVKFLEMPDFECMQKEAKNEPSTGSNILKLLQLLQTARTSCDVADAMPRDSPRILKTHVMPQWLPEDLRDDPKDPRKAVVQIAEFMGKSLPDDVIDKIVALSSFDAMKKSVKFAEDLKDEVDESDNKSFFRKGIVGDWKNIMSEDHSRRVDALFEKKFAGTGLVLRS
ncbi:sulfotransferase 1B1-like [Diadema antillarum]|uniref:sulfotransferase 1B1-like n=1 Tax=Diadema antillarum TaxID=105358 RepID=UPI003A863E0E